MDPEDLMGDGVLVYVGYPQATPDHRAVGEHPSHVPEAGLIEKAVGPNPPASFSSLAVKV